ncbi:hypothetical protein GCM10010275_66190 [Streptomyces litmocidini]|uniref:hypothetical protein n=1 Tax=Streptomyces litmocidini TaxID=67318 RepID=UPI00167D0745|nr:hypothetical protein [Streptomyces litmocidini]GGV15551.1 hypothetical protein GCM10010275_66190 [Streptomyces litmocidini]
MSNDHYYGGQQHDPYADANGPRNPAEVTQTWEGQTWDTTYQPAVSYDRIQADRARAQAQGQTPGTPFQSQAAPLPQHQDPAGHGTPEPYGRQPYPQQPQPYEQYPSQGSPAAYYAEPVAEPAPAAFAEPAPAADPVATAPAADAGPAYSSPTTSGHTRLTDAQRARAEGRSPIIDPGMRPAALTAVLGLLLAGGAALGPYGLLVPLVLLQGLTAAGWFRLNGMWPARQGIALAFLGGLVADAALLATGREHAAAAILGTLGVWVLLCLVLQLRSHADPDERMYGLMATLASAALTVVATGHLGAAPDAVVVGGVAVAAAVLARALPLPGPVSPIAALLASAGAGIAAGGLTGLGTSGALLGLGAGVCALVGLRAAAYDYPSRFVHMTAGVALPLTAAAPAVYLLGRALV